MGRRERPSVLVEISALQVEGRRVIITSRKSGRQFRLPKEALDYLPGAVLLPKWMVQKIERFEIE